MKFPPIVTIKAIDLTNKLPVSNVAIALELIAKAGNNYPVGPSVTDESGIVKFFRHNCEQSIERAQTMFIMDYSGSLADCATKLVVRLLGPDNLETMIKQYGKAPSFWGQAFDNPAELFTRLQTVRNVEFEAARLEVPEHQILVDSNIVLLLKPKR